LEGPGYVLVHGGLGTLLQGQGVVDEDPGIFDITLVAVEDRQIDRGADTIITIVEATGLIIVEGQRQVRDCQRLLVVIVEHVDLGIGFGDIQIGAVAIGGVEQRIQGILIRIQAVDGGGIGGRVDVDRGFDLEDEAQFALRIIDLVDQVVVFTDEAIQLGPDADEIFFGDVSFALGYGISVNDFRECVDLVGVGPGGLLQVIDIEVIGP
jgi:hypothetical protein